MPNDGLQLRRAISIQAEGTRLLEKNAIAPSAARLCYPAVCEKTQLLPGSIFDLVRHRSRKDLIDLVHVSDDFRTGQIIIDPKPFLLHGRDSNGAIFKKSAIFFDHYPDIEFREGGA